jgi:hypothetical protein
MEWAFSPEDQLGLRGEFFLFTSPLKNQQSVLINLLQPRKRLIVALVGDRLRL